MDIIKGILDLLFTNLNTNLFEIGIVWSIGCIIGLYIGKDIPQADR